jgi:hypothetical protein
MPTATRRGYLLPETEILTMKLSNKELTKAIQVYARKHGYSASTVRACTALKLAAIQAKLGK